jgi:hypothetical protein
LSYRTRPHKGPIDCHGLRLPICCLAREEVAAKDIIMTEGLRESIKRIQSRSMLTPQPEDPLDLLPGVDLADQRMVLIFLEEGDRSLTLLLRCL